MKILEETKKLVIKEKEFTNRILENLMVIEKNKLYVDLKYSNMHHYLTGELKYSRPEATLRVNAVALMLKSSDAHKKVLEGKLNLTNASMAMQAIKQTGMREPLQIAELVKVATHNSVRDLKNYIDTTLHKARREVVVLEERTLTKFDRLKVKIKAPRLSSYELIQVMLERELKDVSPSVGLRNSKGQVSRFIPKAVKAKVNEGKCKNCGKMFDLEYDHIVKFSHGGTNEASNLQMLCRSCNQRKEIIARQSGFFA
jgi:hypothetical protein